MCYALPRAVIPQHALMYLPMTNFLEKSFCLSWVDIHFFSIPKWRTASPKQHQILSIFLTGRKGGPSDSLAQMLSRGQSNFMHEHIQYVLSTNLSAHREASFLLPPFVGKNGADQTLMGLQAYGASQKAKKPTTSKPVPLKQGQGVQQAARLQYEVKGVLGFRLARKTILTLPYIHKTTRRAWEIRDQTGRAAPSSSHNNHTNGSVLVSNSNLAFFGACRSN